MTLTPEQIAALANEAAETTDHTETTAGFTRELPAAGRTGARFIEYIELGKQPQPEYQGNPKPDCEEVRLVFELLTNTKKRTDVKEIEVDGTKREIADRIPIQISIKQGEKAGFKKLFEKMRYGRADIKHMAQMLGQAFLLDIIHTKGTKDPTKTYAGIKDADGVWQVSAPRVLQDPMDPDSWVNLKVREPVSPLRIFLFANPSKETWASLFIEGTRTVKDDKGVEKEVSKNWLQEKILSATNYHGSPLEALLNDIGDLSIDETQGEFDDLPDDKGSVREQASADDMAELGL
jgi:hypothetical protein